MTIEYNGFMTCDAVWIGQHTVLDERSVSIVGIKAKN